MADLADLINESKDKAYIVIPYLIKKKDYKILSKHYNIELSQHVVITIHCDFIYNHTILSRK